MTDLTLQMRLQMEASAAKAELAAITAAVRGLGQTALAAGADGAKLGPGLAGVGVAAPPVAAVTATVEGLGLAAVAAAGEAATIAPAVATVDSARAPIVVIAEGLQNLGGAAVAAATGGQSVAPALAAVGTAQPVLAATGSALRDLAGAAQLAAGDGLRLGPALDGASDQARASIALLNAEIAELRAELGRAAQAKAVFVNDIAALRSQINGLEAAIGRGGRGGGTGAAGSVGNLTAQFNDIFVMLAAGQNPMMLAIQQGTQITQVFGAMGASGSVRMIGAALLQMISPVSLVTLGLIAGGAALIQWGISALSGADDTKTLEDRLKSLEDATRAYVDAVAAADTPLSALRAKYGALADEVQRTLLLQRQLRAEEAGSALDTNIREAGFSVDGIVDVAATEARLQAMVERLRTTQAALTPSSAAFFDFSADYAAIDALRARLNAVKSDLADMAGTYSITPDQAENLALATAELQGAASQEAQVAAADRLLETMVAVFGTISAADEATGGMASQLTAVVKSGADLATVTDRIPEGLARARDNAAEMRLELERQIAIDAAIAAHGRESAEVAALRLAHERDIYAQRLAARNIPEADRPELMAQFDRAAAAAQSAHAAEMLAALEAENDLRRAIIAYGEESAEVAALRAAAEREVFEAQLATLDISEDMEAALRAAFEAGEDLAGLDMASNIGAAAGRAAELARQFGIALSAAQSIAAYEASADRTGLSGPDGARSEGWGGGRFTPPVLGAGLPTVKGSGGRGGGGGGGGERNNDLKALLEEAREALPELDLAVAQIHERVERGLMTTAEGAEAIADAQREAAGKLADMVPELEALGPAGAGALQQVEAALDALVPKLDGLESGPLKDAKEAFEGLVTSVLAGSKNAGDALKDLGQIIQNEIAKRLSDRFVMPLLNPLFDGLMGAFSGLFADGAVISNGVKTFAAGGTPDSIAPLASHRDTILTTPTLFPMQSGVGLMAEAGDEAIMPLVTGAGGPAVRGIGPDGQETPLALTRNAGGVLAVLVPAPEKPPVTMPDRGVPVAFARGGIPDSFAPGAAPVSERLARLRESWQELVNPAQAPASPTAPASISQPGLPKAPAASEAVLASPARAPDAPVPTPEMPSVNTPDRGVPVAFAKGGIPDSFAPLEATAVPAVMERLVRLKDSWHELVNPGQPTARASVALPGSAGADPTALPGLGVAGRAIAGGLPAFAPSTRARPTGPVAPVDRAQEALPGRGSTAADIGLFFDIGSPAPFARRPSDPTGAEPVGPARAGRAAVSLLDVLAPPPPAAQPRPATEGQGASLLQRLLPDVPREAGAQAQTPWQSPLMSGPGLPAAAPRRARDRAAASDAAPPYAMALQAWAGGDGPPRGEAFKVEIINKADGIEASEGGQRDEGGMRIMEVIIDRVRDTLAGDFARGSGPLPSAVAGAFGLQRQGR